MRQVVRTFLKNKDNNYLLVKHHKSDTWTLPGGHIDPEEPLHKALKREIKEEFGIKIKFLGEKNNLDIEHIKEYPAPIACYKIYYTSKKFGKVKKWEYIFHSEVKDDSDFEVQEDEIAEYRWFSPEEIFTLKNIFEQIPKILKNI